MVYHLLSQSQLLRTIVMGSLKVYIFGLWIILLLLLIQTLTGSWDMRPLVIKEFILKSQIRKFVDWNNPSANVALCGFATYRPNIFADITFRKSANTYFFSFKMKHKKLCCRLIRKICEFAICTLKKLRIFDSGIGTRICGYAICALWKGLLAHLCCLYSDITA